MKTQKVLALSTIIRSFNDVVVASDSYIAKRDTVMQKLHNRLSTLTAKEVRTEWRTFVASKKVNEYCLVDSNRDGLRKKVHTWENLYLLDGWVKGQKLLFNTKRQKGQCIEVDGIVKTPTKRGSSSTKKAGTMAAFSPSDSVKGLSKDMVLRHHLKLAIASQLTLKDVKSLAKKVAMYEKGLLNLQVKAKKQAAAIKKQAATKKQAAIKKQQAAIRKNGTK